MARQALLEEFKVVLKSVKARTFPYSPRKPEGRCWSDYNAAQRNEYPDVMNLIACLIDVASEGTGPLVGYDVTGKPCLSKPDLAKLVLAQQYDGKCNRVSLGYMSLMKPYLRIDDGFDPSYKTLERAYSDPDIMMLLNDAFFITQQPVSGIEHNFGIDGTCFGTTIKVNWESSRDEILGLRGKKDADGGKKKKRKTKKEFAKTILAAGTTFKLISSFAMARSPHANESPYLKPLLNQIAELYAHVAALCADAAFMSRENCNEIATHGAVPRIFPKENVTLRAKGSQAWRKMLTEFVDDTQRWLREYHPRSIMETINSTMKRTQPYPVRKRLFVRKSTEMLARICVYNIRQLVYLKYTKGIVLRFRPMTQQ